jgi:hypothetical protein
MMRNSASAREVLELEDHVLNGRSYWSIIEEKTTSYKKSVNTKASNFNNVSEKIIKEIVSRRKAR